MRSRSFRRGFSVVLLVTVAGGGAGEQMLPRVEGGWLDRTSLPDLWGERRTVAAIT